MNQPSVTLRHFIILLGIGALGFLLRYSGGTNWDGWDFPHPDEFFLTQIASQINEPDALLPSVQERCENAATRQYFNTACSQLNPNNVQAGSYVYGTLPLFMVRGVAELGGWTAPTEIHRVGRALNAVVDTLSILLVFAAGAALFGRRTGLVAAELYAFAVLPIQQAHFWTVDSIATHFSLWLFLAAVMIAQRGRAGWFVLFGVAWGGALASRVNLLPLGAMLPLAMLLHWQAQPYSLRLWVRHIIYAGASVLLATVLFRILQPYAFAGDTIWQWSLNPKWVDDMLEVSNHSRNFDPSWPPSAQWGGRLPFIYAWVQMAFYGMGAAFGVVATLATAWGGWQLAQTGRNWAGQRGIVAALGFGLVALILLRNVWLGPLGILLANPLGWALLSIFAALVFGAILYLWRYLPPISMPLALIIGWVAVYFGYTGGLHQMTLRYYLPLYGVLAILAAWFMLRWPIRVQKVLVLGVLGASLLWAVAFTDVYREPQTRHVATHHIIQQYPATITFLDERNDTSYARLVGSSRRYQLTTFTNAAALISQPFDLQEGTRLTHLQMQQPHPAAAAVNWQLLHADEPLFSLIAEFNAAGLAELRLGEMEIPAGSYRWRAAVFWEDDDIFRRAITTARIENADGTFTWRGVDFGSDLTPVPYARLSDNLPFNFTLDTATTATALFFPHSIGAADTLTLRVDSRDVTATRLPPDANSHPLGTAARFALAEPTTLAAQSVISLRANGPFFVTGTAIATEGAWERSIPTAICRHTDANDFADCDQIIPFNFGWYNELPLEMAAADTDAKYLRIIDALEKSDLLTIASNRFYDALPRDTDRYPFSTTYYERLFDGALGYTLAFSAQNEPALFGITLPTQQTPFDAPLDSLINEWEGEEALHVYDHPGVFVFENDNFSPERLPAAFTRTDSRNRISLSDYNSSFDLSSTNDNVTQIAVLWVLGFLALGWASYPILFHLLPFLPVRGFGLARGAAWLLLAVIPWWLTAATGFNFWGRSALWGVVALWIAANGAVFWRTRHTMLSYIRKNARRLAGYEALFLAALALGLLLRAVNPDLWHLSRGGEKPMDFAYLNAVLRTDAFPPPSPWLSGFSINYYYFGFVFAALPIKLGAFAPEIGVNLVMATLYAVVTVNVFTLASTLLHFSGQAHPRLKMALAGVGTAFVMLAGNLGTLKLILQPEPNMHPNRWYWYPTRILAESENGAGGAINEMPLFSFLYGDLHAHIMALLPVTLFLAALWALFRAQKVIWAGLVGGLAALIYMSNTWDVLLYAPLGGVVMLAIMRSGGPYWRLSGAVLLGGVITVAPYWLHFTLGDDRGFAVWEGERSLRTPFLLTWGLPLTVLAIWLIYRLKAILTPSADSPVEFGLVILLVGVVFSLPSATATTVLLVILLSAALVLAWFDAAPLRLAHLGVALVALYLLLPEYIVVRGDTARMNTVFKSAFQVWLWLGLLLPLLFYWMIVRRRMWLQVGLLLGLLSLGLLYPMRAIPARFEDNQLRQMGLDGNAFMDEMVLFSNNSAVVVARDAEIIDFLRTLDGFPVIAEWTERSYWWNNRFSNQTGLPAVMGWTNHLSQQFPHQLPELQRRYSDIRVLYTSDNRTEIERIITQYDIAYITLGELEQAHAEPATLAIFEEMLAAGRLSIAFEGTLNRVYKVNEAATQ